MTQCSADAGVQRSSDGGVEAIRCARDASVAVEYAGVVRPLCSEHADSWTASRPEAKRTPLGATREEP